MSQNKRAELVRNALQIFYRNGFHATGMDQVARESGVSKTSIYKHFRTKDELILAVLRLRDEDFRNWLYRRMEELSSTPEEQLVAMFDALGEWFAQPGFQGCMFVKASAEFQHKDDPINAQSMEHKRLLLAHFTALCARAGFAEAELLACQLLILKEGAIVLAAMSHDAKPGRDAKCAALTLMAQAARL